ncbi:hypothetical protein OPU39_04875, partial [Acinetobacter nosocomialis]|nr:hypothetical protein [Acinetobacter nosocomialis]
MGTLTHPLVEDRVISGEGTPKFKWLEAFKTHPLDGLNLQLFRSKRVMIAMLFWCKKYQKTWFQ